MPGVLVGTKNVTAMYLGSKPVTQAYLGVLPVFSVATMTDSFNRPDSNGLGAAWTNLGSGFTTEQCSVSNNVMRFGIPDGLLIQALDYNYQRYNVATHPSADGYVECKMGSTGDPNGFFAEYWTELLRRGKTDNSEGLGLHFGNSTIYIVSRVGSVSTKRATVGSFQSGDVVRMTSLGNVHTVTVNGVAPPANTALGMSPVWNDTTGIAAFNDTAHRSMILGSTGSKDVFGPRRFGPALDYVTCT